MVQAHENQAQATWAGIPVAPLSSVSHAVHEVPDPFAICVSLRSGLRGACFTVLNVQMVIGEDARGPHSKPYEGTSMISYDTELVSLSRALRFHDVSSVMLSASGLACASRMCMYPKLPASSCQF